ncbi:MAG TPA: M23 family peptidase [Treponema sp.]|nr:M23 family peptidase [Treponema sp.]
MSINQYMMGDILEKQQVRRRSKPSFSNSSRGGGSFDDGFFQQIRQKPEQVKSRRKSGARQERSSSWLKRLFAAPARSRTPESNFRGERETRRERRPRSSGFSFVVPSPMTLAVIAGTLVVSLVALNWEGLTAPDSLALEPVPAESPDRNLASYVMPLIHETSEISAQAEDVSLDLTETFAWSSYQVQRGDSVSRIAQRFKVSMDAIIASNNITNARRLRAGDVLRIPNMDGIPYTVKKGDNLSKISVSMKVPFEVILDANDMSNDVIDVGQTLFIPGARMAPEALKLSLGEAFLSPVRKIITSNYGWRADPFTGQQRFHSALDFRGSIGTPIKASMGGTVSLVANSPRGLGNYIIINHANGYRTVYAHLSAFSVKQGDRVNQGDKIGEVGNTGLSTGPHLHFQIYKDGRAINPLDLLQ